MSENYGGPRPEGNQPGNGADPNQQPWQQGAGSANQAPQQWGNQETQQFQSGSAPEAGQYGQQPYNPNATQQFQSQNYGQDQYGQTQAFGAQQGGQYNQGQGYGGDQYGQGQPGSYPPAQSGGGQYGGGGYGQPPYGGGNYGQPPEQGKGKLVAWIVLGVVVLIAAVVGILFATGVIGGGDDEADGEETTSQTVTEPDPDPSTDETEPSTTDPENDPSTTPQGGGTEGTYGSDPELDALYDQCAAGDMAACDDLYLSSGFNTEYEEFGLSCGGTSSSPAYGLCEYDFGSSDPTSTGGGTDNGGSTDGKASKEEVKNGMATILEDYGITVEAMEAAGISGTQLDNYYTCIIDEIYDDMSAESLNAVAEGRDEIRADEQATLNAAVTACQGELGL